MNTSNACGRFTRTARRETWDRHRPPVAGAVSSFRSKSNSNSSDLRVLETHHLERRLHDSSVVVKMDMDDSISG